MADDLSMSPTRSDFEALLDESLGGRDFAEGTVVKGRVAAIEKDFAIIDVGLKTEGRIPVKEFGLDEAGKPTLKVGDVVITEVAAICTYLADEFPARKLAIPIGDPRRGLYLKWLFFAPSVIEPAAAGTGQ